MIRSAGFVLSCCLPVMLGAQNRADPNRWLTHSPTTARAADASQAAATWQALCVTHYGEWSAAVGVTSLVDPGGPCREAFSYASDNRQRVAGIQQRLTKETAEAIARVNARMRSLAEARKQPPPAPLTVPQAAAVVTRPYLISSPPIDDYYPRASRKAGEAGRVLLACTLTVSGQPVGCRVATGSGYPRLDAGAISLVQAQRYSPQLVNGTAQATPIQVPVRFTLE